MARARVSARRQAASAFQAYRVTAGTSGGSRAGKVRDKKVKRGGKSRTVNAPKAW